MANTIKIKAGSGTPTTSNIVDRELAFDRSANKLYINDSGTIVDLTGSASSGDIEGVTAGVGLSGGGSSGTVSLAVDLSELTDMTASVNSSEDELIILDNGADRRKLISEIPLSAFNNDSGFITSTLTTEQVQDIVGAMFSSNTETRISATYQDGDGTIDLVVDDMTADTNTQLSTEQVQDIVGGMFSGNTETRVAATYDDTNGKINVVVDDMTADTNTNQLTTFQVKDGDGTEVQISQGKEWKFRETGGININWTDTDNGTDADPYDLSFNVSTSVTAGTGLSGGGQLNADRTINIDFKDEDNMSSNSASHAATQQSIKAYVDAEVAGVVNSAPAALNTLDELAAALGDDANFATTTSTSLGNRLRVDTASQGLTGTQQANAITNLGITATKAELNYVDGVTSAIQTQLDAKLTSSSSLNGSNISSGTVAAARIANLAASKITSGTFDTARIPSTIFKENLGTITGGTDTENAKATGLYRVSETGHSTMLVSFTGVSGSTRSLELYAHYNDELYFRAGRDSETEFDSVGRYDNKIWHSGNDGSSSGLDADKLDGVQGSSFLRSDATDTASGAITLSNFVSFTMDGNTITGIDDSGEFTNDDAHIMTSAAVEDKILGYGYTTNTGDITAVVAGTGLSGGNTSGSATLNLDVGDLGLVGNGSIDSATNTEAEYSNLPVGYAKMMHANLGTDEGMPEDNQHFYFNKIANRDTSGGWGGIALGYNNNEQFYVGHTETSSSFATWSRVVVEDSNGHATISGDLKVGATGKIYLDGGGNSYIQEESADNLIFRAAGGNYLRVTGSNIVLNDPGASYDVRIEGDTDSNLFFADGSADKVGIGTNSPATKLHVNASGANGIVLKASDNASNSARLFFDGTSTSCIFQEGSDLSFRTGGTTASSSGTERFFITSSGPKVPTGSQLYVDDIYGQSNGTNRLVLDDDTNSSVANGVSLTGVNHVYLCPDETNNGTGEVRIITGTDNDLDSGTADAVAKITNAGEAHFKGDVVAFSSSPSDRELKENIFTIENGLDKVMKLRGVEFDWTATSRKGQHDIGLIAQEVEEVLPEVVSVKTLRVGEFGRDGDEKDFKTVNYEKMVGVLVEAVKELKAEIEELKK